MMHTIVKCWSRDQVLHTNLGGTGFPLLRLFNEVHTNPQNIINEISSVMFFCLLSQCLKQALAFENKNICYGKSILFDFIYKKNFAGQMQLQSTSFILFHCHFGAICWICDRIRLGLALFLRKSPLLRKRLFFKCVKANVIRHSWRFFICLIRPARSQSSTQIQTVTGTGSHSRFGCASDCQITWHLCSLCAFAAYVLSCLV